jgi:hypothetical protein
MLAAEADKARRRLQKSGFAASHDSISLLLFLRHSELFFYLTGKWW